MSVHQNNSGGWDVRWREGKKNRSRTFDRRADAHRFDAEARRMAQGGGVIPPRNGSTTLSDFAEQWFLQRRQELAPKTLAEYASQFDRHVDPYLGHMPLIRLRPKLLDEWQRERLRQGSGPESIAKATKVLSQILDRAVALEEILNNPAQMLRPPVAVRRQKTAIPAAQVEQVRAALGDWPGERCLVSFLAYVGCRPSEALALHWEDIKDDRVSITKALTDGQVKATKNNKNRTAVIPHPVVMELKKWRLESGRATGLIWARRKDGLAWKQHDWDRWRGRRFKPACRMVGLETFTPYELRHTAASIWLSAGHPPTEVAAQLGNSPSVCLDRYQHLIDEYRGRNPGTVDELIDAARDQARRPAA